MSKVAQFSIDSDVRIPSEVIYQWISQPLLAYYKKRGYVKPSIRDGHRGFRDYWSIKDVLDIRTIIALREEDLSMQKIGKVIKWLRSHDYCLSEAVLATDGENVWQKLDDQTIEIISASAGQVICLDWSDIVKEVMEVIENSQVEIKQAEVA